MHVFTLTAIAAAIAESKVTRRIRTTTIKAIIIIIMISGQMSTQAANKLTKASGFISTALKFLCGLIWFTAYSEQKKKSLAINNNLYPN